MRVQTIACIKPISDRSWKWEQFESEKQDAEAQSQHNTDNTAKPPIAANPMVMVLITMV